MESVCDKPQAARTRGPKIRVVGAIRVGNHKQVVVNVEVKPSRLYLIAFLTEGVAPGYLHRQADVYCLPGKASSFTRPSFFIFHSSLFTLHLVRVYLCLSWFMFLYAKVIS